MINDENELTDFDKFMMTKYTIDAMHRYNVAGQIYDWVREYGTDGLIDKMESLFEEDEFLSDEMKYFLLNIYPMVMYHQYVEFMNEYNKKK